jgi:hypothetical protein
VDGGPSVRFDRDVTTTPEHDVARFPGLRAGYESFYLCAREPGGRRAVWIRYTVDKPARGVPIGSVWCTLFDVDGPRATKVSLPDPRTDGAWLRVGEASIRPGHASASLPTASWEIAFRGEPEFRHLPSRWWYAAPLPRTKPVSLHPAATFDGSLTFAGDTVDLAGWSGMVGHNWGTQHAERWIWLHGLLDDGWIDLVLGRVKVAGRLTPWTAMGGLSRAGHLVRLGGGIPGRGVTVADAADRCAFTVPDDLGPVTGEVRAPLARFVGWTYDDPDGSSHEVLNCSIAELALTVAGQTLTATRGAAYERGTRERGHGVPIQGG